MCRTRIPSPRAGGFPTGSSRSARDGGTEAETSSPGCDGVLGPLLETTTRRAWLPQRHRRRRRPLRQSVAPPSGDAHETGQTLQTAVLRRSGACDRPLLPAPAFGCADTIAAITFKPPTYPVGDIDGQDTRDETGDRSRGRSGSGSFPAASATGPAPRRGASRIAVTSGRPGGRTGSGARDQAGEWRRTATSKRASASAPRAPTSSRASGCRSALTTAARRGWATCGSGPGGPAIECLVVARPDRPSPRAIPSVHGPHRTGGRR